MLKIKKSKGPRTETCGTPFFIILQLKLKPLHSVSLGTDPPLPLPLANHNLAISFDPPGTENLNKFSQGDKKP